MAKHFKKYIFENESKKYFFRNYQGKILSEIKPNLFLHEIIKDEIGGVGGNK